MNDLTGQRFGLLLVEAPAEPYINNGRAYPRWRCRCDCGATSDVVHARLLSGKTSSCGCMRRIATRTHGHASGCRVSGTYNTWCDMIDRCTKPTDPAYPNYGGRGIKVCDRWLHSFEDFLGDVGERPDGMTIEREHVNGNYEPGNVRWATRTEQNRNTRATKLTTAMAQEIRESPGVPRRTLAARFNVSVATIKAVRAGRSWRD